MTKIKCLSWFSVVVLPFHCFHVDWVFFHLFGILKNGIESENVLLNTVFHFLPVGLRSAHKACSDFEPLRCGVVFNPSIAGFLIDTEGEKRLR